MHDHLQKNEKNEPKNNHKHNLILTTLMFSALSLSACSLRPAKPPVAIPAAVVSSDPQLQLSEQNKKIVVDFYQGVFLKHQVSEFADLYLAEHYIQHNPHVADGKTPFVKYFKTYFKENPEARNQIKRVIASGDLVALHVHSIQSTTDRGQAIVDIFRVENGKIVEHWDVIQAIPEQSANSNSMF
ncbi:putative SnoaL-like aldol condensation-catalyzing enzyme [Acinetobacter calcoaceticus]|uniref:Putative SnoaL-like aldol condensation-catalyzing enzyme n=1 Tax=Acinetobacter calcoaceticus TaxID=471 RepID=A0A4R1XY87_ACICA|nr:putative SnoaL-like aldol condensation-catalyzing enzyme [Acinetobacter calcoaceticus]